MHTRGDSSHCLRFAVTVGVDIGVIGHDVASWIHSGCTIAYSACFGGYSTVSTGYWRIVGAMDHDADLAGRDCAGGVLYAVGEHVGQRIAVRCAELGRRIRVIDGKGISTIAGDRDRAIAAGYD